MASMTRRYRVSPSAATLLPGDRVLEVDLDRVEPAPPGPERDPGIFVGEVRPASLGGRTVEVVVDGWRFVLEVEDHVRAELRRRATRQPDATTASGPTEIRAIIPGRIAAIRIEAGDVVEAGQGLLVVEAMKMQNELRAPRAGTVVRIAVEAGQTIDTGDLLAVLR